jgi:membrane dipeptidase
MQLDSNFSRRRFLSAVAIASGAAVTLRRSTWAASAADSRVDDIVHRTIGVDTHNHIDVPLAEADLPGPDIDLALEMKRSGLSAICMTFATDYQPGEAYGRFLAAMAAMDRQLERNKMHRSLTSAEIQSAHQHGEPTVVQSVEGGHFLEGHLERVEEAYHRGLRHLGLLHDSDASVPLGDVYTNPPRFGGLTPFGAAVVKECNRLGILIDLAHANIQTTEAALKLAARPVIISHTGLDTQVGANARMAEVMRPRLISREQAAMIAHAGGLVGVWTHLADSPLEYAQNIRALADVIGVDHVCVGTDTKLTEPAFRPGQQRSQVGVRTNQAWAEQNSGFYYVVVDAMLKTGFTPDEIGKIGGGNFLRVFGQAVGG